MKLIFWSLITVFLFACNKDASDAKSYSTAGKGGSMARFTIAGNYLYTVDHQNLNVFDISNPANPVHKKTVHAGFEIETIFPFKDKLFIGSTSVVHIFSIDDPVNPQKLSEAVSPTVLRRCDPVVAKDTVAFATLRASGPCGGVSSILAVYDIKDVKKPIQKAFYELPEPYGLGYEEDVLYVCDRTGLKLFDISKPYELQLIKSLTDGEYIDVIPYGDVLFCWVKDGLLIYNIADRKNPVRLTHIL